MRKALELAASLEVGDLASLFKTCMKKFKGFSTDDEIEGAAKCVASETNGHPSTEETAY